MRYIVTAQIPLEVEADNEEEAIELFRSGVDELVGAAISGEGTIGGYLFDIEAKEKGDEE